MCFGGGGGKSAEQMYQERKPEFGPLPSLSVTKKKREEQVLGDVPKMRRGMQQRSLLDIGKY
jgi:hypothetical protein